MKPTCIELFAGAGGASVGLHRAGFHSLLAVEWDKNAHATLAASGMSERAAHGDVRDSALYDGLEDKVDLLWASPPCQAWSTSGKRLGAFDDRNGWPWTFDIIQQVKPRWVLCENVTGMEYHREGCQMVKPREDVEATGTVLGMFGGGGEDTISPPEDCPGCYWTRVVLPWFKEHFGFSASCVVNSANYGTPQRRERVIILAGPRNPQGWGSPWPHETNSLRALVKEKNDGTYWTRHGIDSAAKRAKVEGKALSISEAQSGRGDAAWLTVRDAFATLPPVTNGYANLWVNAAQLARTSAFRGTTDVAMNPDMPSDTVTCRRGGSKTNDALIWDHDGALRYLTLAEVAALQAFPLDYPWQGSLSAKYKQVGNAVPPPVAEALGRVIASALGV